MFFWKKKKFLKRDYCINLFDSNKIWSKSLNVDEILNLLNQFKNEISKYYFESDSDFIMNGRRTGLQDTILERFKSSNNKFEENVKDSLVNIWEFLSDEYDGNVKLISMNLKIPEKEILNMCSKYRQKNIICLQEKDIILDMISKLENYIIQGKK